MPRKHLASYLNDHLAGAATALELLKGLEKSHSGTDMGLFAAELRAEVSADREVLEALMERLGIARSAPRQMGGWLAEKAASLKLHLDDPADGTFRLLETLEALSLGIEGKHSLWCALEAAVATDAELVEDYSRLRQRAEEQRKRTELLRLSAARQALTGL